MLIVLSSLIYDAPRSFLAKCLQDMQSQFVLQMAQINGIFLVYTFRLAVLHTIFSSALKRQLLTAFQLAFAEWFKP